METPFSSPSPSSFFTRLLSHNNITFVLSFSFASRIYCFLGQEMARSYIFTFYSIYLSNDIKSTLEQPCTPTARNSYCLVVRIRNVKRFVPLKGIRKKKKSRRLRGKRRRGKSRFSPNRFPDLHSKASRSASLCCRRSGPAFEIELLTLCRIIRL